MTPSIVCGIDASPQAHQGLNLASLLAERLALRLVLVHAVPAATPDLLLTAPTRVPTDVEQIDFLGRDTGEQLLDQAADTHDVTGYERRLEIGNAAERLCAVAHEEQAEFVVVGSRGVGTLHSAVLGSVSTAIIRDAPCPTVVVPPAMAGAPLNGDRIVCGVQDDEDGPAVTTALRLSRKLKTQVTLVHVLPAGVEVPPAPPVAAPDANSGFEDAQRHALQSMRSLLEHASSNRRGEDEQHGVRFRRGDPARQLLELAASTEAVLLVVGSRRRGTLRAGLLGSVSRELVRNADRPVVVCRRKPPT